MLVVRGPMMARRDYPDGSMSSFLRYFELLREALSDKPAIDRPLLDLTESAFREAAAQGQADLDIAAIFEAVRQRSS